MSQTSRTAGNDISMYIICGEISVKSKLCTTNSSTISKLCHAIFQLEYALCIYVCNIVLHGRHFLFSYAVFIWVHTFYSAMQFSFLFALFIQLCSFHLGTHFLFSYAVFIWITWVCNFFLVVHLEHFGIK